MDEFLQRLPRKARRGSKPRCHFLTHGTADAIAARLTGLAAPFATVTSADRWMPQGFDDREEAQLHQAARLIEPAIGSKLKAWWLAPGSQQAMTPNFDIASTCTIEDQAGLLLIEAKAHDEELSKEVAGRVLGADASDDRRASHGQIAAAIAGACEGLAQVTSLQWAISQDSHYQMSNRFAWAWKLTELGLPVVLIYLGFLKCEEMRDRGRPFADHADWERVVRAHAAPLFAPEVWDRPWTCNGRRFVALIRSIEQPLTAGEQQRAH